MPKPVLHKVVVLGDGGVGKTALTVQICLQHFVESYDPTIEDSYRRQVVVDDEACMIEILDTAGQEEYTALRDQWIRDGEGVLLVYDISSRKSFTEIRRLHEQVKRVKESLGSWPVPIMVVGNKSDREMERQVSKKEGHILARELGYEFVETSAKTRVNVEKAFYDIVRLLRQLRQAESVKIQRPSRLNLRQSNQHGNTSKHLPKRAYRNQERQRKCVIL
ncbi:ras-2 protein [Xylariales sp. PMI_506]|nr:ras-2 protein [Xylariales sp. PMI_506]